MQWKLSPKGAVFVIQKKPPRNSILDGLVNTIFKGIEKFT